VSGTGVEPEGSTPAHSFTVAYDEADYRSANWLFVRANWKGWRLLRATVILVVIYWVMGMLAHGLSQHYSLGHALADLATAFALALAVMVVLVLWFAWCIPHNSRKLYRDLERLGIDCTYTFDGSGIRAHRTNAHNDLRWDQIPRWLENDRVLTIFLTRRTFFVLPKSQIATETLDALRSTLIAARVPHR
jgi:hypothetical protein